MEKKEPTNHPLGVRDVRHRALTSARWAFFQTIVVAFMGPVAQILKARFLSPSELAAVAVFMIVYGLIQTIENAALGPSIVQKETLDRGDRFTFLLATLLLGLIGMLLLLTLAGRIEQVFGVAGSGQLLRWGGALILLAMTNQFLRSLLNREMLFRGTVIAESLKRVLHIPLLAVFFMLGFGPVSVLYALLLCALLDGVLLLMLTIRAGLLQMRIDFKTSTVRHLIGFGGPISGKQVLAYLTHRADEFTIALALSPETLGAYHLAKETLQRLQVLISGSFSRVLLSLFSKLRGNPERLSRVYARIALLLAYIGIPIFVGVALTASDVVPAVFGAHWTAAVLPFQFLSIALIPIVLTANLSSALLYAAGKSSRVLVAEFAINTPYLIVLYGVHTRGLSAILWCYLAYCFVKGITLQAMANRQLRLTGLEHLQMYARASLRVAFMAGSILLLQQNMPPHWGLGERSAVSILAGGVAMLFAVLVTDRDVPAQFISLLRPSSPSNTMPPPASTPP